MGAHWEHVGLPGSGPGLLRPTPQTTWVSTLTVHLTRCGDELDRSLMTTCRKRAKRLVRTQEGGQRVSHPTHPFWMGKLSQPVSKLVLSSY